MKKLLLLPILCALALISVSPEAFAQAAAVVAPAGATAAIPQPDGSIVFARPLVMEFNNWVSTFLALFASALASLAYRRFSNWLGVKEDNEEKDRILELLRNMVKTQAGTFIAKLDGAAMNASIDVRSPGIATAVNKVIANLPEAEARIGATPEKVADMIVGEIGKLQAAAPVIAPPTTSNTTINDPVVNVDATNTTKTQ